MDFDRAAHCRRIASRGGRATVERHGRAHMSEIGRKGWAVTTARYFAGSERLHAAWLAQSGLYNYWDQTGLPMKRDIFGRPVWPEMRPQHPARLAAPGQRGLFEAAALTSWATLPF